MTDGFEELLTSTVTVSTWTETGEDSTGAREFDYVPGATYAAWVQQDDTDELVVGNDGQDTLRADWLFMLMPDAVVSSTDRLIYQSEAYEIVGRPELLRTPQGPHHYEIKARLIEG